MPKIRIGLSTDFNLVGEQVGIGTTNPTARLDVAGQILADNTAGSGGISTFKEYQGFHQTQSNITNNVLIDNGSSGPFSSLSGEIRITGETTVSSGSTVEVGKTKTLTVTDKFAVPFGDTNNRDNTPEAGTTRFNQDFGTLEFFDGNNWKTVNSYARPGGGGRGINAGGTLAPGLINNISYVNISTQGNSLNFGNLSADNELFGSCASETRGIFGGGRVPTYTNAIEYITIASEGNSINFGTLSTIGRLTNSLSSSTRGVFFCGFNPSAPLSGNTNTIDYIQISTLGNALDFGDSSESKRVLGGFASSTRGVFGGGFGAPVSRLIEFITISSTGNAIRFGDLTQEAYGNSGCSNSTRGLFGGLNSLNPGNVIHNIIEYVTIATTGSSTDFGDLTVARYSLSASSSQTRAVWCGGGGDTSPSVTNVNTIDYVTISTAGNAIDFGDHLFTGRYGAGCSDSHGGLGGF
jgi:hypothetical protein